MRRSCDAITTYWRPAIRTVCRPPDFISSYVLLRPQAHLHADTWVSRRRLLRRTARHHRPHHAGQVGSVLQAAGTALPPNLHERAA